MRLVPLKSLESSLVPTCAKEIYTLDDWGNSFLVWSDEESYAMFSLGKNGQADHQYGERPLEQIAPGPFDDFVGDIVWGPSGGIRWPRGITP
jgi:hypothetical protein